jgi:uncharacterized protein
MRWTPGGLGSDVEDRRGAGGGGFGFGRGPTIGCGGAVILLVLSLLTGKNFFALFDGSGGGQVAVDPQTQTAAPTSETPEESKAAQFASFVMTDAQDIWTKVFQEQGIQYQRARIVLYREMTQTACGVGQAAAGPFYCPADNRVYIDLAFNDELSRRFGAPGDFAQAYVIAHEVGHHVQNLLGISDKVHQIQQQSDKATANEYSVRLELQADCYAGIWAHSTARRDMLEPGDVEEGLGAASAVGDDRIQKMSGRAVSPESFTHGSSEQRMEWFQRGFRSGRVGDCDTFQ